MKNELKVGTIQMTCGNKQHENQLKIEEIKWYRTAIWEEIY